MINVATEDQEQEALFQWAALVPELKLMHAIPNGGYRHPATAARLARTGVKAGVPDICLPVARGKYHALYIELKRRRKGAVSVTQAEWHRALRANGYAVHVCLGWEAAKEVIEGYLAL